LGIWHNARIYNTTCCYNDSNNDYNDSAIDHAANPGNSVSNYIGSNSNNAYRAHGRPSFGYGTERQRVYLPGGRFCGDARY
jgi:hypothetical protein